MSTNIRTIALVGTGALIASGVALLPAAADTVNRAPNRTKKRAVKWRVVVKNEHRTLCNERVGPHHRHLTLGRGQLRDGRDTAVAREEQGRLGHEAHRALLGAEVAQPRRALR